MTNATLVIGGRARDRSDSASGRVDEVLEIVTFVRWCGSVEPLPDVGCFDQPRCGGRRITCGPREACEPFEGGSSHARFAEPAAEF